MNSQYTDIEMLAQIEKLEKQHAYVTAGMIKQLLEENKCLKKLEEEIERLKGFEEIQGKIWKMFGSFAELKRCYETTRRLD